MRRYSGPLGRCLLHVMGFFKAWTTTLGLDLSPKRCHTVLFMDTIRKKHVRHNVPNMVPMMYSWWWGRHCLRARVIQKTTTIKHITGNPTFNPPGKSANVKFGHKNHLGHTPRSPGLGKSTKVQFSDTRIRLGYVHWSLRAWTGPRGTYVLCGPMGP